MTELLFGGVNPATELEKIGARFKIAEIRGRDVQSKNIQQKETQGSDGASYLGRSIPPRTIEIDYSIKAKDRSTILDAISKLNGIFSNHDVLPLSFDDQEGTFYGVQSAASEDLFKDVLYKGSVSIYCADPFRYGDNVETGGSVTSAQPLDLDVLTNYRALPVLTFTTQATAAAVTIEVNNRAITYEPGASIPAGTVIRVDGIKKELRIGSVLKVLEVDGWFPYFVGGANRIETTVSGSVSVSYRERYI